jgi:xylan 1,4-beta-xylosidase
LEQRASLIERKGYIRLYGAESLNSKFYQSLLAHRQQSFYCEVVTKLDFKPRNFQQMAGLTYFYNTKCYYYLYITHEENIGRVISIIKCDLGKGTHTIGSGESIAEDGEVWMKLTTHGETAQYAFSLDGQNYMDIGEPIDASILSDDYFNKTGHIMFTGAFIGICCQDLSGQGIYGDFDFFSYKHLDEE